MNEKLELCPRCNKRLPSSEFMTLRGTLTFACKKCCDDYFFEEFRNYPPIGSIVLKEPLASKEKRKITLEAYIGQTIANYLFEYNSIFNIEPMYNLYGTINDPKESMTLTHELLFLSAFLMGRNLIYLSPQNGQTVYQNFIHNFFPLCANRYALPTHNWETRNKVYISAAKDLNIVEVHEHLPKILAKEFISNNQMVAMMAGSYAALHIASLKKVWSVFLNLSTEEADSLVV